MERPLLFITLFVLLMISSHKASADFESDSCSNHTLPHVRIKRGTVFLNPSGKVILDSIAKEIKKFKDCKIRVTGHSYASEEGYQMSWDRVVSVIRYLTSKGIDKNRFIFEYGVEGDPEKVILSMTDEDGPAWVPAPVPCFSYHKLTPRRCKHTH